MQQPTSVSCLGLPPAYRRGLQTACDGFGLHFVSDPAEATVIVTPLRRGDTCATVDRLVEEGRTVVALVDPFDRDEIAHALHHGAAPGDWDAEAEAILAVAAAAADRNVLVSMEAAARLVPETHVHRAGPVVTPEEARWLRDLAKGVTVARLADEVGYSERAMFRRLADLYARLGVTGRAEAMVAAERHGLLTEPAG
jgi:DNA-binding NarL/FixJ family response regulator